MERVNKTTGRGGVFGGRAVEGLHRIYGPGAHRSLPSAPNGTLSHSTHTPPIPVIHCLHHCLPPWSPGTQLHAVVQLITLLRS